MDTRNPPAALLAPSGQGHEAERNVAECRYPRQGGTGRIPREGGSWEEAEIYFSRSHGRRPFTLQILEAT